MARITSTKKAQKRKPRESDLLTCPHCGEEIPADVVAGHLGRLSAKKMKGKRGPDYFRRLQAKRKTKGGGRPPKSSKTSKK